MQSESLLHLLRDIHQPSAVNFWPLAPGWYALIALVLILFIAVLILGKRHIKRKKQKKALLLLVDDIFQQQHLHKLSALLKRIAIKYNMSSKIAALQGDDWLQFLDQTNHKSSNLQFQSHIGQVLIQSSYQRTLQEKDKQLLPELYTLTIQWVKYNV